jgi:hypothetical protein
VELNNEADTNSLTGLQPSSLLPGIAKGKSPFTLSYEPIYNETTKKGSLILNINSDILLRVHAVLISTLERHPISFRHSNNSAPIHSVKIDIPLSLNMGGVLKVRVLYSIPPNTPLAQNHQPKTLLMSDTVINLPIFFRFKSTNPANVSKALFKDLGVVKFQRNLRVENVSKYCVFYSGFNFVYF